MMYSSFHSQKAFSIIEVMIGVFIFTLGLVAVFVLLISSLQLGDTNKNSIIASYLATEQIELIRNLRDTNYQKIQAWDVLNPLSPDFSPTGKIIPGYYRIENNFSAGSFSTQIQTISDIANKDLYRLCLNNENIYTYDCSPGNTPTIFYRYLSVESISGVSDAFQITSVVQWMGRTQYEYDIKTIITDWRKI